MAATDPLASGASTPEGKLSIFGAVAGVVIAILAALQPVLQKAADSNPNNIWFRLALGVAGLALAGASTWSFTKSQTVVKGGILDVLQQGAATLAPMVAAVVLKKYLDTATNPTGAAAVQAVAAQLQKPTGTAALTAAAPPSVSASAPKPASVPPLARP